MKPRKTPELWRRTPVSRMRKRTVAYDRRRRREEREPRWKRLREMRRALAIGRAVYRKNGWPTAGGDCARTGESFPSRVVVMGVGYGQLRERVRGRSCGICGATEWSIENPCGNPCNDIPF